MLWTGLDPEKRQIRLLIIKPGLFHERIVCDLIVVSLDYIPKPNYECLSYRWGPVESEYILINGVDLNIPTNLFIALKYLRQRHLPRVLWADAICIDQNSYVDRSRQVAMMHEIYAASLSTVVWLGEESEDSALAMSSIAELSRFAYFEAKEWYGTAVLRSQFADKEIDLTFSDPAQRKRIVAIYNLVSRPWFKRIWMVQESTLANYVQVACGHSTVAWTQLSNVLALLVHCCKAPNTKIHWDGQLSNLLKMDLSRKRHHAHYNINFLTLIHDFRDFQATEKMDKVFALRGLASDPTAGVAKVDYSSSAAQVYTEATINMISSSHGLCTLYAVQGIHIDQSLPSWVPDWSLPWVPFLASLDVYQKYHDLVLHDAEVLAKIKQLRDGQLSEITTFDLARSELHAQGLILDVVEKIDDNENDELARICQNVPELRFWEEMLAGDIAQHEKDIGDGDMARINTHWFQVSMGSLDRRAIFSRRRLATLKSGTRGLISADAATGDAVCFLGHQPVPFVLRQFDFGSWRLIGQFLSCAVLSGQCELDLLRKNHPPKTFVLI